MQLQICILLKKHIRHIVYILSTFYKNMFHSSQLRRSEVVQILPYFDQEGIFGADLSFLIVIHYAQIPLIKYLSWNQLSHNIFKKVNYLISKNCLVGLAVSVSDLGASGLIHFFRFVSSIRNYNAVYNFSKKGANLIISPMLMSYNLNTVQSHLLSSVCQNKRFFFLLKLTKFDFKLRNY